MNNCVETTKIIYCKSCFTKLEKYLRDHSAIPMKSASEIYIGRSAFPERRLLEHFIEFGRDRMTLLHWASDWDEIDLFEDWLIKEFDSRKHLANESYGGGGRYSGSWSCVYLSWKAKRNSILPMAFTTVSTIDLGSRIWPTKPGIFKPVHFELKIDEKTAKSILKNYDKNR